MPIVIRPTTMQALSEPNLIRACVNPAQVVVNVYTTPSLELRIGQGVMVRLLTRCSCGAIVWADAPTDAGGCAAFLLESLCCNPWTWDLAIAGHQEHLFLPYGAPVIRLGQLTAIHACRPRRLRILATLGVSGDDIRRLTMASDDFMLATGDQSLGEVLATGKRFHYECEPHKKYLMEDLGCLDAGLGGDPPANGASHASDVVAFRDIFQAGRQATTDVETFLFRHELLCACYPGTLQPDALIFVTCKDAGGRGDIANAMKTIRALRAATDHPENVCLVLATTARNKALEIGMAAEDVWLVVTGANTNAQDIRRWDQTRARSDNVLVVHVAAELSDAFEQVIKDATATNARHARSVKLLEYGYSHGARWAAEGRGQFSRHSMGVGVGEFGIHIDGGLVTAGGYSAAQRSACLGHLANAELRTRLLEGMTTVEYSQSRTLYAGYSHHSGVSFINLVAHMERFSDAPRDVDIVCLGNDFRVNAATVPRYTDLVKELDGEASHLDGTGFSHVELVVFSSQDHVAPQVQTWELGRRCVATRLHGDPDDMGMTAFFELMNPRVLTHLPSARYAGITATQYCQAGRWLHHFGRTRFDRVARLVRSHKDFNVLALRYLARSARSFLDVSYLRFLAQHAHVGPGFIDAVEVQLGHETFDEAHVKAAILALANTCQDAQEVVQDVALDLAKDIIAKGFAGVRLEMAIFAVDMTAVDANATILALAEQL